MQGVEHPRQRLVRDVRQALGLPRVRPDRFGRNLDAERDRWLFAGDSPNDEPLFAAFPVSVGVANVAAFAQRMTALPRYVTPSVGGFGFAELAARILELR